MNYTLNQLRVFHKVVETKSITRAAEELFMTQPAVSIQLKNFQEQFNIPLTELKGRKIQITDFGMEIATITEKALDELMNLQYKTREYEGMVRGKLKISSASNGKYVIPFFLSEFLDQHSGIDLVLDVTNKTRVVEELKNKECEFAVVSVLPKDLDVEEELLVENKLFLVSKSPQINRSKPLIFREKGSATRSEMEKYFGMTSKRDWEKLELTSNEAVKQAVIAGIGSSMLPLVGLKNELLNGSLKIIERRGLPIVNKWRLIWLKNRRLTPVAESYLKYIRANKERILHEDFEWYLKF